MKDLWWSILVIINIYGQSVIAKDFQKTEAGVCLDCNQASSSTQFTRLQDLNKIRSAFSELAISQDAQNLMGHLEKKGFVCDKDSSGIGRSIECVGKLASYKKNTRVYIPKDLQQLEGLSKINFFLHGFKSPLTFNKNKNDLEGVGDFAGMLAKSKNRNSILVVPESDGQCLDYEAFVTDPQVILKMKDEIQAGAKMKYNQITLAGHSGAYRAINSLVKSAEVASAVQRIALFDSIYDSKTNLANIRHWLSLSEQNKLKVAYVTGAQQSTEKQTLMFLDKAAAFKDQIEVTKLESSTTSAHMRAIQNGSLAEFLK